MVFNLARDRARTVVRNDFSHIGITPESTTRQDGQAASSSSREIRELKSEMSELKRLLKLSFDVQLDMQRALRQEIAALVANTWTEQSANLVRTTRTAEEGVCVICTENGVDSVLYQCGHMCACYTCAKTLMEKSLNCPVCRAPIKDVLRAYRVGLDK